MPLEDVEARVAAAVARAGRPDGSVTLVAVSKLQPRDRVLAVLAAGQRVFGENRVQEAEARWPELQSGFPDVALHLVGPLQTNKLARALELFTAIHSLDRDSLARKLAAAVQARGACPTLFVQVNTGREPQKAGVDPDGLDGFLAACRGPYGLPVFGLMAIPPVDADPAPALRPARRPRRPPRPRRPLDGHERRLRDRHRRRRHPRPHRLGTLRPPRRRGPRASLSVALCRRGRFA